MAKLSVQVFKTFAPLQLQRIEIGVGQLAFGRRGRQRPGVESAARAEQAGTDAVDCLNSNGVSGIRS